MKFATGMPLAEANPKKRAFFQQLPQLTFPGRALTGKPVAHLPVMPGAIFLSFTGGKSAAAKKVWANLFLIRAIAAFGLLWKMVMR